MTTNLFFESYNYNKICLKINRYDPFEYLMTLKLNFEHKLILYIFNIFRNL